MNHKRNINGIVSAAKTRRKETIQRVDNAIGRLLKSRKCIDFTSVAEEARVSKVWLYKEEDFAKQIRILRSKSKPMTKIQLRNRVSDDSKDAIIRTYKERILKSEKTNAELRKQLEIAYGRIMELEEHKHCYSNTDS